MKINGGICDICDHTFRDANDIIGLLFHGTQPGEFTWAEPADTDQHICRACCQRISEAYNSHFDNSLTRKAVR